MTQNRTKYEGKWYTSNAELVRQKGAVSPDIFRDRLRRGWPLEEALLTPSNSHQKTKKDYHRVATERGFKYLGPYPRDSKTYTEWQCAKKHLPWEATYNRIQQGDGCPSCSGQRADFDNNLEVLFPEIAKQWHPTKNGSKKPSEVTAGTNETAWWHCPKSKLPEFPHDYETVIKERTRSGKPTGCPCCSGNKVCPDTCLSFTHPEMAKQWHPTRNGKKKPSQVTAGSGIKRYWLCPRHPDPEEDWYVSPNARSGKGELTGCPDCRLQTSRVEIRVYTELKSIFKDAKWPKAKVSGQFVDVVLPSQRIGIEVDGAYYHIDKVERDRNKNKIVEEYGYMLVRLRGKGLPLIGQHDITFDENQSTDKAIRSLLLKLSDHVSSDDQARIQTYLNSNKYANEKEYKEIIARFPAPPVGESFEDKFPEVAKFWDYEANAPFTPDLFTPKNDRDKVWWKCAYKDYHPSFQRTIYKSLTLAKCEYCLGGKVHVRDSLATLYPEKAKDWDYKKNKLPPKKVWPMWKGRRLVAFWICSKCGYDWHASPYQRCKNNRGCRSCNRRKTNQEWGAEKLRAAHEKLRRNVELRQQEERKGLNTFLDRYIALCHRKGTSPAKREVLSILNKGTRDAPLDIRSIAGYEDLSGQFDKAYRVCDPPGYRKQALCWTDGTNTERRLGKDNLYNHLNDYLASLS